MTVDAANAVMSDDKSIIGAVLPRILPGGIAAQRALNLAPQMGTEQSFVGGLQREFVNYEQMQPDGKVPVFRSDGSLLKYESPVKRIFASVGLGPYMNRNDQELHKFLVTNRQKHDQMKADYIAAQEANNFERANRIAQQFEKKFGVPLTVTEQQVERFRKNRQDDLKSRMVGRMNPMVRQQYQPFIQGSQPQQPAPSGTEESRMSPQAFESYGSY